MNIKQRQARELLYEEQPAFPPTFENPDGSIAVVVVETYVGRAGRLPDDLTLRLVTLDPEGRRIRELACSYRRGIPQTRE